MRWEEAAAEGAATRVQPRCGTLCHRGGCQRQRMSHRLTVFPWLPAGSLSTSHPYGARANIRSIRLAGSASSGRWNKPAPNKCETLHPLAPAWQLHSSSPIQGQAGSSGEQPSESRESRGETLSPRVLPASFGRLAS